MPCATRPTAMYVPPRRFVGDMPGRREVWTTEPRRRGRARGGRSPGALRTRGTMARDAQSHRAPAPAGVAAVRGMGRGGVRVYQPIAALAPRIPNICRPTT
jgi:hypothetical protein